MRYRSKIALILLLLGLWCVTARAQQLRPYLVLGKYSVKLHDSASCLKPGSAFRVGAGCYVPVMEDVELYVVPEFTYSSFKYDNYNWIPEYQTFSYRQLHLRTAADYRLKFTDLLTLDLGAGPFVSYGVGGDAMKDDNFGRWNAGLTFRASLHVLLFNVGLYYDWGMLDIMRYGEFDDYKERLSMFGLSFGFGF